ncbi:MAG TPA: hypothetical protein PLZ25_08650 [Flavobacteriales bacterium]|nr:hypothetical protein [Flavobacteriales bacterium]
MSNGLQIGQAGISYAQVAELVLSLSTKDQIKLAEDLRLAGLKAKWEEILTAFQPNSISEREIVRACKEVRRELWEERRDANPPRRR